MQQFTILSLLVGSLGFQASLIGGWMRWRTIAIAQEEEEEEEILTRYDFRADIDTAVNGQTNGSPQSGARDLRLLGWEFKIVRANRDLFRNQAILQRLCEEEAEAGWVLLEKLDDRRVRFKRPVALRDLIKPERLSFDPYRCHYGPGMSPLAVLLAIAAISAFILPAYLGYALVSTTKGYSPRGLPPQSSQNSEKVIPLPSPVD
ncbi:hypothetical protein [Microseira sp. BLCC-F43]|jgi:hypothetical protein|uniref:hypothetical protein n=1 Tax=Microseira sp. BLCC-F43 TaxID=3153602 RepID=UPI0035B97C40